ncbi:MAG: hypothetical protein GY869_11660, partial [Planctomycetes bacterium]|nr:hypothetical protein [Planctomycetota bacterium]
AGRQIIVNSPGNSDSTRYIINNVYDKLDRVVATHFPDGTFVSNIFNFAGYPEKVRDRKGRWTTNTFDAAGHLVRVDFPNGDFVKKTYKGDLVSNLIDGEGNETKFYYDHEQLIGVEFPDGTKRAAGFDNLNNQIWAVDERGIAVTNVFDKANRLLYSKYLKSTDLVTGNMPCVTELPPSVPKFRINDVYGPVDQSVSYKYDEAGNITEFADWTGANTYEFDQYNRPIFQTIENPPLRGAQG